MKLRRVLLTLLTHKGSEGFLLFGGRFFSFLERSFMVKVELFQSQMATGHGEVFISQHKLLAFQFTSPTKESV